jgi:hypothetical protein
VQGAGGEHLMHGVGVDGCLCGDHE